MCGVDKADQLHGNCCPTHWLQNQKWWWSIFIWAIWVAAVIVYLVYSWKKDWQKKKIRSGQLGQKLTHLDFCPQLLMNLALGSQHSALLLALDLLVSLQTLRLVITFPALSIECNISWKNVLRMTNYSAMMENSISLFLFPQLLGNSVSFPGTKKKDDGEKSPTKNHVDV